VEKQQGRWEAVCSLRSASIALLGPASMSYGLRSISCVVRGGAVDGGDGDTHTA